MKKVYLSVFGFALLCRLNGYAQTTQDTSHNKPAFSLYTPVQESGSGNYESRALHIDEINLVSSYYYQNGDHSPITGGIGTENVTDISNGLDLKLAWTADNHNTNTLSLGFGYDHHTSASAAYVALHGGAKTGGTRFYPSIDWTTENAKTGNTFGIGAYYSGEYNYKSIGADLHWTIKTADKNGEFGAKLQGYFDRVTMILPSELIPPTTTVVQPGTTYYTTPSGNVVELSSNGSVISNSKSGLPTSPRTTLTASFSYSQIINSRMQIMFLGDVVNQTGYLGLPFHRVYFAGVDTAKVEKLPSTRFKIPLGFRLNYFVGDNIIIRSYYRFYKDSWGILSNTAGLEVPVKITPFFSISPFYRYYDQTAAKYFAPYDAHVLTDEYYTSNYAYSKFKSDFFGIGFRIAPPKGVFGWQNLHEMEIRYGHYTQTTDLVSDVVSISLGFK